MRNIPEDGVRGTAVSYQPSVKTFCKTSPVPESPVIVPPMVWVAGGGRVEWLPDPHPTIVINDRADSVKTANLVQLLIWLFLFN
jgi:hypothetical protein